MSTIVNFFENELTDYACYSTLRMIASSIDGLKNSSRKVIYTALCKGLNNETKVSVFDNVVQSHTQYLHGSCAGVIQNIAADYCGSNQLPLLKGEGNFGSRFVNDPAAPRYIYVKKSDYLNDLFDINDVLINQYFEGEQIEPLFLVPSLPLLLINGSMNGLASGFKQHILPRKISEIINYIQGKKANLNPYIEGFTGKIYEVQNEDNTNKQFILEGVVEITKNKAHIVEIPPFIEYQKYLEILDNLVENKKIKSYTDLSNTTTQKFEFNVVLFNNMSESDVLDLLKLRKKETEIYNALDENNQVVAFKNVEEILNYYISVRSAYLLKQKEYDLEVLNVKNKVAENKYKFIKMIIDKKLDIMKKSQSEIIERLEEQNFYKFNESFDYLLKMPIHSFAEETLVKLKNDAEQLQSTIKKLKSTDVVDEWKKNLKNIKGR